MLKQEKQGAKQDQAAEMRMQMMHLMSKEEGARAQHLKLSKRGPQEPVQERAGGGQLRDQEAGVQLDNVCAFILCLTFKNSIIYAVKYIRKTIIRMNPDDIMSLLF